MEVLNEIGKNRGPHGVVLLIVVTLKTILILPSQTLEINVTNR